MTSHATEIEFKFAVADSRAFELLLQHLDLPDSLLESGVSQTNHFFDSPSLCLHQHHFVIRLRQAGRSSTLTVKGERKSPAGLSGALTERIEEEVQLPAQAADDLLHGRTAPKQVIGDHFKDRAASLLQLVDGACPDDELIRIGQFCNVRIHLPPVGLPVGDRSEHVSFELDSSTFPGGRIDHEIEVEITAQSDAAGIEAALIDLFRRAGIDWFTASSKAARFFDAIESASGH